MAGTATRQSVAGDSEPLLPGALGRREERVQACRACDTYLGEWLVEQPSASAA
jgi:hypothetical protein